MNQIAELLPLEGVPACETCFKPLSRGQIREKRRFCSAGCVRYDAHLFWKQHNAELIRLHCEGAIYSEIAKLLGCTRNAVIGRIGRLKIRGTIIGRGKVAPPRPDSGAPRKARSRPRNKPAPKPTEAPLAAIPLLPSSLPLFATKPLGEPASLMEKHTVGCCRPINDGSPYLYCNAHKMAGEDNHYCPACHALMRVPAPVRTTPNMRGWR